MPQAIVTMALFNSWKKLLLVATPLIVGNAVYRKWNGSSEFIAALTENVCDTFHYLSLLVGGGIMIDHLSLLNV